MHTSKNDHTICVNGDWISRHFRPVGASSMTTAANAPAATETAEKPAKTFKEQYNEALNAQSFGPAPRNVGEAILAIIAEKKVPVSFSKLTKEIAEAASRNDIDTVLKLSHDLKNVKDNESQNKKAIQELHTKFKFHDVVQAFQAEFEELSYQLALKGLTETHVQLVNASKKTRSGSKSSDEEGSPSSPRGKNKTSILIFTKPDGTEITFPMRMGPKGNVDFKFAEDAYKAMGFELIKDGDEYGVEPGTIELNNGEPDLPVNRKNLVDTITAKTAKSFEGWSVKKVVID